MHIREFQEMMRRIYFHRDSKRGPFQTYAWICSELGEFGRALLKNDRAALEAEVADLIAWIASECNLLGIDLEAACSKKYPGKCPKCGKSRCECPF